MNPLSITAFTLTSALGKGNGATLAAIVAEKSGLRPCDFADVSLDTWIGRVDGVEEEVLRSDLTVFDCRNNRLAQMALRQDRFQDAVAAASERHGPHRIAVILGTTTSGVLSAEEAFFQREDTTGMLPAGFSHFATVDHYSLCDFVSRFLDLSGPAFTVSTACSSSAKVFADASELIGAGLCDAAVVGGADSLCRMVLRGFASLGLVSARPCRPNDVSRDGISIGEAAGFALIEKSRAAPSDTVRLLGYGNSCDAHHMSSPDPEGGGATLAIHAALNRAGLTSEMIDYVHQHGTGTLINDRVEDAAIASVFGNRPPCSSTKGWTGHTLGAAGITNVILTALFLRNGILPRNLNLENVDRSLRCRIVEETQRRPLARALTNSFGFGGSNCCLILGNTS